jgi:hypothetical protein
MQHHPITIPCMKILHTRLVSMGTSLHRIFSACTETTGQHIMSRIRTLLCTEDIHHNNTITILLHGISGCLILWDLSRDRLPTNQTLPIIVLEVKCPTVWGGINTESTHKSESRSLRGLKNKVVLFQQVLPILDETKGNTVENLVDDLCGPSRFTKTSSMPSSLQVLKSKF